jgi:hypothetical protein
MASKDSLNVITITKIKITGFKEDIMWKDQLVGVELGFSEEVHNEKEGFDHVRETPTVKLRNFFAHDDLITMFRDLGQHMAIICEFKKTDDFEQEFSESFFEGYAPWAKHCYVQAATVTGSHENAGVMLEGYRILSNGKKLKLQTPNIIFGASQYEYDEQLSELMDQLTIEGLQAYEKNKRKIVQAELPFEGEEDDENAMDDERAPEAAEKSFKKATAKLRKMVADGELEITTSTK